MRSIALIVLTAALPGLAPPAHAQKAPARSSPKVLCSFCKDKGAKDCKKHGKGILELERKVLYCSVAAACKTCAGALSVDCKRCKNPVVEQSAQQRRQLAREFLDQRRQKVDKHLRKSEVILHGRTDHVVLAFSVQPLTVGRQKLDTHRLMHLYLERLEALYQDFKKTFALTDADFNIPLSIYMFRATATHLEIAPRVTGIGGRGTGRKFMGSDMVYCMCFDRKTMRNDDDLHGSVAHNVAHLLVNRMRPHEWIYNKRHGWLDAGIAHWFEHKASGSCRTFCHEEVALDPGSGYKGGKWRVAIRKLVEAGDIPRLGQFYNLKVDQLTLQQHAVSFAYVDFLIRKHGGAKLRDVIRMIKKKTPTSTALNKVYKLNVLNIEEPFRQWVRENYPLK